MTRAEIDGVKQALLVQYEEKYGCKPPQDLFQRCLDNSANIDALFPWMFFEPGLRTILPKDDSGSWLGKYYRYRRSPEPAYYDDIIHGLQVIDAAFHELAEPFRNKTLNDYL